MRNWEMGVLFHETETNLLYVGENPSVLKSKTGIIHSTFPIPFEAVEPTPFPQLLGLPGFELAAHAPSAALSTRKNAVSFAHALEELVTKEG